MIPVLIVLFNLGLVVPFAQTQAPALGSVYSDLFSPEGSEIYLKQALNYVLPAINLDFGTVVLAARQHNETAIGYRLGDGTMVLNPAKSTRVCFGVNDQIIVAAETG